MTGGITFKNMPGFTAVMREYAQASRRDDTTIVMTKAFYIARGAVRNTHRSDKAKVKQELQELVGARAQKTVTRFGRYGQEQEAPLAAILENASRGKRGQPGLYGSKMAQAVKSFIGRRLRSIGFLASGFLPAIKTFEPLAERTGSAPRIDQQIKQHGQDNGSARALNLGGLVPKAIITNFAQGKGDHDGRALEKYAGDGLQKAFDDEMVSMREYIIHKKQGTANKYSTKHH